MNDELIPREIELRKLKKGSLNILRKLDPYINFMNQQATKLTSLPIYPKDYRTLAEDCKNTKQDIRAVVYRGCSFRKHSE